jgi:hypothetical protein
MKTPKTLTEFCRMSPDSFGRYLEEKNKVKFLFDELQPFIDECSEKLIFQPSAEDYAFQVSSFYMKLKDELIIEALTAIGFDCMEEKCWKDGKFHNYPDGTQEFLFYEIPLFRINLNICEDKLKIEKLYKVNS